MKCAGSGFIEVHLAPMEEVDRLWPWVERVIGAVERVFPVSGVGITDIVAVDNFTSIYAGKKNKQEEAVRKLSEILGIEVGEKDLIIELAEKLKEKEDMDGVSGSAGR
jgi:hypothetical protein